PCPDRRGQRDDRGVGATPRRGPGGLPRSHRHAPADGAGVEERGVRRRRGVDRAGGQRMSWDSEHFDPLPPSSVEPPPQQQKHWLRRLLAPLSGIALLIWKIAGPLLLALKNVKLFAISLTFLVSLA